MKNIMMLLAILATGAANAEVLNYQCVYTTYATEKGLAKEVFKLHYITDTETNISYLTGNQGSEKVTRIENDSGVSFIEVTGTGNVMTTSITTGGVSVHSRHLNMFGEMIASQFYGSCK